MRPLTPLAKSGNVASDHLLFRMLQQALRRRSPDREGPPTEVHAGQAEAGYETLLASAAEHGQRGELKRARELLSQVLARSPEHAGAHDVLGSILRDEDRLEEALDSYARAIRADPGRVSAHSNLGLCLRDLGRLDEARTRFEHARRLDPSNPTIATNLAALLFDTGHFDEASGLIDAVLSQHPDFAEAHLVRGTRLLRRGELARGWADYEWRDRDAGRLAPVAYRYPIWNGEPTNEPLLVCCEQGLGDQIMFASCLEDLLRIAPHCIVECDARLTPIFARSMPQARFYRQRVRGQAPWLDDGLVPAAKTWLGSLPLRFRRSLADFPQRAGYLQAESARTDQWRRVLQSLGPGLKVGISWRGGTGTTRRALRSIPLEQWLPLLRQPGIQFVSLQYGDVEAEIEQVRKAHEVTITHWDAAIRDYDETAALISALDLVVSVQTAVVHLAGALGSPVRVLVPGVAEWRYGERDERMPWYPSIRLFRQERGGDWKNVMESVRLTAPDVAVSRTNSCRRP